MFDYDDIETADPTPDPEELDRQAAEQAGQDLASGAFNVRLKACKTLSKLGAAAVPYLPALLERSQKEKEDDYTVRNAARDALRDLREAGFELRKEEDLIQQSMSVGTAASGATASAGSTSVPLQISGPVASFEIFGEVLHMRLERPEMTPAEVAEVWENSWGIEYAGRIRFRSPPGAPRKWLNSREDPVPRPPVVIFLESNVGSLLATLATALKTYGAMSSSEALEERMRKNQEALEDVPRRRQAIDRDARKAHLKELRRRQKKSGVAKGITDGQPWTEHKLPQAWGRHAERPPPVEEEEPDLQNVD
mmetsp:Transcript_120439/g.268779  ORF Transcript_120439/g.268779 Transcript_120439/m.268779 type:complete len:308 (-) Transcript_120439:41-964(-)|eukprot:CAMPEP_0180736552 /NCGR_PEP_ID=MMETSP1038_2-20121128/23825_1 /TAXON_ID=632150 /ORGANISM="Azadinium spinosum, Strain 3D9" /LENGTH=307 /DNA_ID=CAMNT_0022769609 /DNA_START=118 /DNA_END=1041 /DNA_ORIENTATION=-